MTPPPRRPTSTDVAARAGVSRATVSMVLNGRIEGTVAPATRDRVLAAAEELGYARSAIAVSLRDRRTRTIGVVTDEISTSPWAGRMIRAAAQEAAARDHMVITVDLSLRGSSVEEAMRMLAEREVDGLIHATMGHTEVAPAATTFGLPLVLLNCRARGGDGGGAPAFVPDDRGGAERAVRRLLDVGHRRITMLSGGDEQVAARDRERGFRDAIETCGDPVRAEVVDTGWQMDDGYRVTARLLARPDPPTALFCIRDRVAAGAIQAAARAGIDVPGELSVIGFDDEDFFAEALTPPLTTIALPHEEMGVAAIRALLDELEGSSPRREERPTVVPCPLVERATVASPARR